MESDFYSDVVSVLYSYLDMRGTFHVEEVAFNVISMITEEENKAMPIEEAIAALCPVSFSFSSFDPNGRSYEVNTELTSGFHRKIFKIEGARLILESKDEKGFDEERRDKLDKMIGKRTPIYSMVSYDTDSVGKLSRITITTPSVSELKDFLSALKENIKAEQS